MSEACRKFDTPVTGGNVSFYNQSPDGPVYPTPTIGMVGLLNSVEDKMTLGFRNEGDIIYLIGQGREDIGSSEYLHKILGVEYSPAPYFDLDEEFHVQQAVLKLIQNKLILSAHDISEGGLMICLLESGFVNGLGFNANSADNIRKDAWWFGESQGRVVVSVSPGLREDFIRFMNDLFVPFSKIGIVTGGDVIVDRSHWGGISEWISRYENAIPDCLAGEENLNALTSI
jgi:phosphoribosylformylglycinamidine synthase